MTVAQVPLPPELQQLLESLPPEVRAIVEAMPLELQMQFFTAPTPEAAMQVLVLFVMQQGGPPPQGMDPALPPNGPLGPATCWMLKSLTRVMTSIGPSPLRCLRTMPLLMLSPPSIP
jgi:hypothetical protein